MEAVFGTSVTIVGGTPVKKPVQSIQVMSKIGRSTEKETFMPVNGVGAQQIRFLRRYFILIVVRK